MASSKLEIIITTTVQNKDSKGNTNGIITESQPKNDCNVEQFPGVGKMQGGQEHHGQRPMNLSATSSPSSDAFTLPRRQSMRRRDRLKIIEKSREAAMLKMQAAAQQNKMISVVSVPRSDYTNTNNNTICNSNKIRNDNDVVVEDDYANAKVAGVVPIATNTKRNAYVATHQQVNQTNDDDGIEEKKEEDDDWKRAPNKNNPTGNGQHSQYHHVPVLDSSCREKGAYELVLGTPATDASSTQVDENKNPVPPPNGPRVQVTINRSMKSTPPPPQRQQTSQETAISPAMSGIMSSCTPTLRNVENNSNDSNNNNNNHRNHNNNHHNNNGNEVVSRNDIDNPPLSPLMKMTYNLASPLARMRDSNAHVESILPENYQHSSPSRTVKSSEEVKKEKQAKWKKHMKRAQKQKLKEKKSLEADQTSSGGVGSQALWNSVLDDIEQTRFFDLFRTQCGTYVDSDESSSSDAGDYDESDSSDSAIGACDFVYGAASNRKKQRRKRRRRRRRRRERRGRDSKSPDRRERSPSRSTRTSTQTLSTQTFSTHTMTTEALSPRTTDGYLSAESHGGREEEHDDLPPHSHPAPSRGDLQVIEPPQEQQQHQQQALLMPANWSNPTRTSTPLSPLLQAPSGGAGKAPALDKLYVKSFITEAVNDGFSMLWHKEQASMKPAPVTIRLKAGHYQTRLHCGPRLVWSDQSNDRYGVDIFNVRSLDRAKPNHLKDFPFAIPGRSVCLKLKDDQYFVFEASSEDEAWRFVHGLRWVVARLTFNLVIGNVDVSCELLDVGTMKSTIGAKSSSLFQEFEQAKAMDDLTEQMVNSLAAVGEKPERIIATS